MKKESDLDVLDAFLERLTLILAGNNRTQIEPSMNQVADVIDATFESAFAHFPERNLKVELSMKAYILAKLLKRTTRKIREN